MMGLLESHLAPLPVVAEMQGAFNIRVIEKELSPDNQIVRPSISR
jgi:hypothetical protein